MGLFDEVHCNHELFGVHKGETHQTKDLNWMGGAFEQCEITPSGRLEFLEYITEDRSDPIAQGWRRLGGSMAMVFTGGRCDLNYHGWLELSCFGRAKFTDGILVAVELEGERAPENPGFEPVRALNQKDQVDSSLSDLIDQIEYKQKEISTGREFGNEVVEWSETVEADEGSGVAEGDSVPESTMEMNRRELADIARRFRGTDLPSWGELDAFTNLISPSLSSQLAWRLNKALGLDANAIRQLLEDKSIGDAVAEDWLRFEKESGCSE